LLHYQDCVPVTKPARAVHSQVSVPGADHMFQEADGPLLDAVLQWPEGLG
jgi:hypothetical protein